ncbi:MAG: MamI family restriction endonuclease [Defluviitaleaceae bacterium]|nr:MamI family restriction endonuclease [Defluviitaleaceae bacterium]
MGEQYELGTIETSEKLIEELYINLRRGVNFWSNITHQTPQARMGYIGQHLVSVVTGFRGGKSGARGYDLILSPTEHAEIKTCYRVDQLGACKNCRNIVSSLETVCAVCNSNEIERKDDSKWLISIRNDDEFAKILIPKFYYFVLFEFEKIHDTENNNIIASIWKVNSKSEGFAYCMIDYFLNIRASSVSKAPFNMWPHSLKFYLTCPELIYRSKIRHDNKIETIIFPTLGNTYIDEFSSLREFSRATTLTKEALQKSIDSLFNVKLSKNLSKNELINFFDKNRRLYDIPSLQVCNTLASNIYLPLIKSREKHIPDEIKRYFSDFE